MSALRERTNVAYEPLLPEVIETKRMGVVMEGGVIHKDGPVVALRFPEYYPDDVVVEEDADLAKVRGLDPVTGEWPDRPEVYHPNPGEEATEISDWLVLDPEARLLQQYYETKKGRRTTHSFTDWLEEEGYLIPPRPGPDYRPLEMTLTWAQ